MQRVYGQGKAKSRGWVGGWVMGRWVVGRVCLKIKNDMY